MKIIHFLLIMTFSLYLSACKEKDTPPPPAIAHIPEGAQDPLSHMDALETPGSKGQILFNDGSGVKWFGNIANMLAYLQLPDTATKPMTAYVTLSDTSGQPIKPWQWMEVHKVWFVLLPPKKDDPFALATWVAFSDKKTAEHMANATLAKLYRFDDIHPEDLVHCH